MRNICDFLKLELIQVIRKQHSLQQQLKNLPAGQIRFDQNRKYTKWRWIDNDQNHIRTLKRLHKTEDRELASALTYKQYLSESEAIYAQQHEMIADMLRNYPAEPDYSIITAAKCKDFVDLLRPYMDARDEKIQKWLSAPFESCADYPERKIVPTKSGILVRSKSEAMIADELFINHIPFRYEQALMLGDVKIYPDFTILDPETLEKELIWEHFGLMDVNTYGHNAKVKLGAYIDAGYIPGKNPIITYESKAAPLDINYVDLLIMYHLK